MGAWRPAVPSMVVGAVGTVLTLASLFAPVPPIASSYALPIGTLLLGIYIGGFTERMLVNRQLGPGIPEYPLDPRGKPLVTWHQLGNPRKAGVYDVPGLGVVAVTDEDVKAAFERHWRVAASLTDVTVMNSASRECRIIRRLPL